MQRNLLADVKPGFATLFWDSLKTTGYFGGVATGAIPAVAGAIACTITGGTILASITCSEKAILPCAIFGAVVLGAPVGTLGGSLSTGLLSVPFTIGAYCSRQFKSNNEITPQVELLASITDKVDQQNLINEIIHNNKRSSRWIRSYESYQLMETLESNALLNKKWEALTLYMNKKNGNGAYIHNGKKLFNTILSITKQDAFALPKELRTALQTKDSETVQNFIELNPQVLTQPDSNGMNFLHRSVIKNDINAIATLVETTIDLDIAVHCERHPNHGKTALDLALEYGHVDIVRKLITSGAILSEDNNHPIHLAAKYGHNEIVNELLFMDSSNANLPNHQQQTPVQLADKNGHPALARYLVEAGATDHDFIRLKHELAILYDVIHNPGWSKKGWGLFSTHTPKGIKWLRTKITPEILNSNNREQILEVANKLREHDFGSARKRIASTSTLYQLVNNLGSNTNEELEQLANFRSHQIGDTPYNGYSR